MAAVLIVSVVGAAILFFLDQNAAKMDMSKLQRNDYGKGSKVEDVVISIPGKLEKETVQIEVAEREYTTAELKKVFEKAKKKLDILILKENKSLDEIRTDMNLLTKIPDESIEVMWQLSRYDVMDMSGKLQEKSLSEKGTLVELKAVMTYLKKEEERAEYVINAMVYPKEKTTKELIAAHIKEKIEEKEIAERTKKTMELPKEVGGEAVAYGRAARNRSVAVILLGVAIVGTLVVKEKEDKRQEAQRRKQQMMLDYPEIVDKFTLLISAGMTTKNAWYKMVDEYEQKKAHRGVRYAYEEMKAVCYEMRSGISEMEAYERFAKRCNLQSYLKLGALLSQNLRKGTKGLTELLQIEASQAFEERKTLAKRQGEEAGTKLLLPMFFMLGVVLVIVIVPAFLSVRL